MKKQKKRFPAWIAVSIAVSLLMTAAASIVSAGSAPGAAITPFTTQHEKIGINAITGEIVEPPMLTSAASAVAKEKEWYEYIYYSENPVAHYYLNDNTRISFYDPYDYADALVMEVDDTLTDWSSNNSMQISYTTGNSITNTTGKSTETSTSVLFGYTDTTETTTGPSTVTTTVKNQTDQYNTSKTVTTDNSHTWSENESASVNIWAEVDFAPEGVGGKAGDGDTFGSGSSHTWKTGDVEQKVVSTDGSGRSGYTKSTNTTTVEDSGNTTTVTNTIADRTTKATGYITNSTFALSTNNSTTVTKTYDAGYFNNRGAPLQWKIIEYTIKMPMYYQVENLVDGEWIFGDSSYCVLNTVQGTCRAWMENNVAYYEHWGTGEPVTWDGFWGQFFTESSLIDAYKNRLYPD